MKKLLTVLALVLTAASLSAQTLTPPSNGHWVIVDTSYTVGTSTTGTTQADLYYANQNGALITGLQFRVFYDEVAFAGAAPTVSLLYSTTDQYMQYVTDTVNGHITVSVVYTGTNSSFSYSDGAAFRVTFTHADDATWNNLAGIDSLEVTGTQTFNNLASTNQGLDTTLSMHSYGGAFIQQSFDFEGTFLTTEGDGAKDLSVIFEKKEKTSSTWAYVDTYVTDNDGHFAFTQVLDTTYWDTRIHVKGDTLSLGNVISTADAQKINQSVLGQYTPTGFDFYTMDVNGSGGITISDAYAVFGKIAGNFANWPNSVQNVLFFTPSEFASIDGSSSNLTSSIPGVTEFTHYINGGADSVAYYVAVVGDANATGFQMARLTPVEIVNPANAPNYIIDQTVHYDNVLEEVEVRFPDLEVDEGNLVNVPVKVITGTEELTALQLNVKYDQDLLEFKNIINSEKVMNWMSFFNPDNGKVHWGGADFSGDHNLTDGDTAFTLQFAALEPKLDWATSPLWVAEKYVGDVEANDMNILPTNGRVQIFKVQFNPTPTEFLSILAAPNPANDFTRVGFNVLEDSEVEVSVFDFTGQKVVEVLKEYMPKGEYSYDVNLTALQSGFYYTVIRTSTGQASTKIVKLN